MLAIEDQQDQDFCWGTVGRRSRSEKDLVRKTFEPVERRLISSQRPRKEEYLYFASYGVEPFTLEEKFCVKGAEKPKSAEVDELATEISRSRYILELEDNWDDAGSPGYKAATWLRAIRYLQGHASRLKSKFGINVRAPIISQGPDGSIDIYWKTGDYRLLLNIPEDKGAKATFYGEDSSGFSIKGELDTSAINEGLLLWLVNKERK